jgi:hypothetical protein
MVPTVLKSESLNLPEPSGPVQACNGIALPLPLILTQLRLNVYVVRRTSGKILGIAKVIMVFLIPDDTAYFER